MTDFTSPAEEGTQIAGVIDLVDSGGPTTAAIEPQDGAVAIPESWKDALPADLRDHAVTQRFRSVEDAIRSTISAQSLVGADKIVVPKDGDDGAWEAVWNRLGRPERPEDYEIAVPEGLESDADFDGVMRQAFHTAGLTAGQVKAITDAYSEHGIATLEALQAARVEDVTADQTALKREWGAAHDQNVAGARAAARGLGMEMAQLDELESGLGYSGLIRHFHRLYETYGIGREDGAEGQSNEPFALSPTGARQRIQEAKGDKAFMAAYLDRQHPGHADAVDRMSRLHALAHPGSV